MLTNLQPVHRTFFPRLFSRSIIRYAKVQSLIPRARTREVREVVLAQTATAHKVARAGEPGRLPSTTTTMLTTADRTSCVPGEPKLPEQQIASHAGKKLGAEWLSGSIGREGEPGGGRRWEPAGKLPPLIPAPLIRGERDKRRKFLSKSRPL